VDHVSRAGLLASLTAGMVLLATAISSRGGERRASCPGSLVPAYVNPGEILDMVRQATLPRLLVINPASGPGAEADPGYRRAIEAAQETGARVLGYVPTTWGARPAADVGADVDRYRSWYGVDGVFLDEAASGEARLTHYQALALHARGAGAAIVVLNPGVVPARGYFAFADVVVTFEGPLRAYRDDPPPTGIAADRTAHLVYGASREQALSELGANPAARYVYFTSGALPHPWGTVPEYLPQELAALGACR
jgi:spherulation-specific family 4 protein